MFFKVISITILITLSACSSSEGDTTPTQSADFNGTPSEQAAACTAAAALAPAQSSVQYVGNIWREEVDSDAEFTQLWNQITPENAGKWGQVEQVQDNYNWETLDRAHDFALNLAMPYKFHTLVWGANQPAWIADLTPELQQIEIEQWFDQIAQRYPTMAQLDVVNEPIHSVPVYSDALNLLPTSTSSSGQWAWVVNAHRSARQKFPNTELLLNDFNILRSDENTDEYLGIIELLQAESLIDGIGLQAHFLENTPIAVMEANLNKLGATGLPLYISEFDLNIENDQTQLERMQALFPLFYSSPHVKGITLWGFRENQIWQTNSKLINSDGTKRPAMRWLECYLGIAEAGSLAE